jgi:hypothetical protein
MLLGFETIQVDPLMMSITLCKPERFIAPIGIRLDLIGKVENSGEIVLPCQFLRYHFQD